MEILSVVFLRHVLVYGQPRRADAEFSGPREAQLLQERNGEKEAERSTDG